MVAGEHTISITATSKSNPAIEATVDYTYTVTQPKNDASENIIYDTEKWSLCLLNAVSERVIVGGETLENGNKVRNVYVLLDKATEDNAKLELGMLSPSFTYDRDVGNSPLMTTNLTYKRYPPTMGSINSILNGETGRKLMVQLHEGYAAQRINFYNNEKSLQNGSRFNIVFTKNDSLFVDQRITDITSDCGQFENLNLFRDNMETYLVIPHDRTSANVTLTLGNTFDGVKVNGGEKQTVDYDGKVTITVAASKYGTDNRITLTRSDGDSDVVYNLICTTQKYDAMPDAVVEYLCIGSQYTNITGLWDYGLRPVRSLVGSNYDAGGERSNGVGGSGPVSLGNFGGYITYYFKDAIYDDPNNPYGIDFVTFGNSVEGSNEFGEPGQVWVSENGTDWFALAGGMHYENYADWEYEITYTKDADGTTSWSDNRGGSADNGCLYPDPAMYPYYDFSGGKENSITLRGIHFKPSGDTNEFGNIRPPFAGFGYTDMGMKYTFLPGEDWTGLSREEREAQEARNLAGNPYLGTTTSGSREFSAVTDGMDLAWAVDAQGQPASFPNGVHYVKIVTASNIDAGAIGEKSTEVNMVRVAQANDAPVGKTAAPTKIIVDGIELTLEEGKFVYDDVPVDGPFKVAVDAPEGTNVYINNVNNQKHYRSFDGMPTHKIVRVIVQEGQKEPAIYILNLKETTGTPAPAATLTLDANGVDAGNGLINAWVNGNATYSFKFDANMSGDPLPTPTNRNPNLAFGGWYMGQRRFDAIPDEITDTTLTALWIQPATTPVMDTISVSFRLIGSTLSTGDIDLTDGDYKGAEYVNWIKTTRYTMDADATVADLFTQATGAAGIRSVGADRGYVSTVYAPDVLGGYALSEFTNGPKSGWMYTKNGVHTNAINVETMEDGDVIIFHYVNDYAWEVADWGMLGGSGWPQLSDSTNNYWSKWLTAADTAPGGSSGNNGSGDTTGGSTSSGDKKDETKPDETPAETTMAASTVTADDGSTVKTETEKVVDTTTNADGSVTETVTETTKTTVTTPDNVTTVTETVVETETTTDTVKNDDGSVTDKTETVEKVTETVTGEDGKQTTTVTETAASSEVTTDSVKNADGSVTNTVSTTDTVKETVTSADGSKAVSETTESKSIETTVGADGKTTGTGTVSATTTVKDESGKTLSTAVTEGTVAVSTDDKGTVSEVTTATTKTTDAVTGEVTEETTVTTEAEMANGTTGKTVENEKGETLSAEANVSEAALQVAQNGDGVIELPITVNTESGATVQLNFPDLPDGTQIWAEIGTSETSSGDVAYLKLADGVVKLLPNTKTGSVIVPVNGSCEVIVKDNSKSFTDVDTSAWYGDSVKFVTAREIFNGNGDGTFAPGETMNRAMAAQIIFNFDGATAAGSSTFSDVDADAWYAKAVAWAAAQGIVNGYNGAYSPLGDITRQDLVKILYFYAQYAGYDVEGVGSDIDLLTYADGADVSDYAAAPMRWAIASGLIQGYADNTLRPRNTATRAEVAAIMQRMVMNVVK